MEKVAMKKSLLALAVLSAFAGAASAQSSVTVFGIVDLSVNRQTSNGVSITTLDSNQLNSNRIGFRGIEDLGGGMKAGFWLEAGMSSDTGGVGSGSLFFNRRSTVSLMGNDWGEIRLGRDYTPSFWMTAVYDVFGANGLGEFANLTQYNVLPKTSPLSPAIAGNDAGFLGSGVVGSGLGGSGTASVRANNSIAYWTPGNLGGFYARIQGALNEGGPVNGNKYIGFLAGWAAGPIDVAVGYGDTKTPNLSPSGSQDLKVSNIGGSYDFGVAKVYALYNQSKFDPYALKTFGLSAGIPVGPGAFNVSYVRAKVSGAAVNPSANQWGGEYVYNLSKRTALYAQVARISNSDGASFQFGDLPSSVNVTNQNVTGYGAGLRHSF
jgi:predicted porin